MNKSNTEGGEGSGFGLRGRTPAGVTAPGLQESASARRRSRPEAEERIGTARKEGSPPPAARAPRAGG